MFAYVYFAGKYMYVHVRNFAKFIKRKQKKRFRKILEFDILMLLVFNCKCWKHLTVASVHLLHVACRWYVNVINRNVIKTRSPKILK